jgi:adenylosuccinate lyase
MTFLYNEVNNFSGKLAILTTTMPNFKTYLSPFTWRYASLEMRGLWSEEEKRRLWRRIWVALAEVQSSYGLVTQDQLADLRRHADQIDMAKALEIEAEIHHDLMAELKAFAAQCPVGGGVLHQGATSMDIEDNADVLRLRLALDLVLKKLSQLLKTFANQIDTWADLPIMAFTHIQPAEPSTLGYRLAQYAQDLLMDWQALCEVRKGLRGKGFTGAVGTSASYSELLGREELAGFQASLSQLLDLPFFPVSTQTYPRKQDYWTISALAGLAGSLYKFAFDLRLLQSPPIGEWSEPFAQKQVGSSAMPFKRNPINAEKINSLARALAQLPRLAWDNAAHSLLERTLDDSANRRSLLPEAFLAADELLQVTQKIVAGLQIDEQAIKQNMITYGPFAATERVLMALSKAGGNRQQMHERLRQHAMEAWVVIKQGEENPLIELVSLDPEILALLPETEVRQLMDALHHIGDAPQRARQFSLLLRKTLEENSLQD